MASVSFSPIGNAFQFFDTAGKPLNAGFIYTYLAGTSTPKETYTTNLGTIQNANPIVLNSDGRPPQEIWLVNGFTYKFVLTDSLNNVIGTYDNITVLSTVSSSGINFLQTGTGAVVRSVQSKEQDWMSIRDFGATGDGVTDDTASIQAAITAATGGILYIPPANPGQFYAISTGLTGVSNIYIIGSGYAGQIRNINAVGGSDIDMLTFSGKTNFIVDNVYLRGAAKGIYVNTPPTIGTGIQITNCTNFVVRNNFLEYMSASGICVMSTVGNTVQYGVISGNYCNNCTSGSPFDLRYGVSEIYVFCNFGTIADIQISGNTCISANHSGIGVIFSSTSTGSVYDIKITENVVANKLKHGIYTYSSSDDNYTPLSVIISNNIIRSCNWMGIYCNGAVLDYVISSNRISDCCKSTLLQGSTTGTINIGTPTTLTVASATGFQLGDTITVAGAGSAGGLLTTAITNIAGTTFTISPAASTGVAGAAVLEIGWNTLAWAAIGTTSAVSGGGGTGAAKQITITGNSIKGFNGHSGIRLIGANYSVISSNVIRGDGTSQVNTGSFDNGITIHSCTYVKTTNNIVILTGAEGGGVWMERVGGSLSYSGNSATGNVFIATSQVGIYSNNQNNAIISGNQIILPGTTGIYFSDGTDSYIESNLIQGVLAPNPNIRLTSSSTGAIRTIVRSNKMISSQATGYGIWNDSASNTDNIIENNDTTQLTNASVAKLSDSGTRTQVLNNKSALVSMMSAFTCANNASTVVSNSNATSPTQIILWPTNAAGANLMAGAAMLYVSAVSAGTSFTVTTANGSAAAGTETIGYRILS